MDRRVHPWARHLVWRIDAVTRAKFEELWKLADGLDSNDPACLSLVDEMKCLPGYPSDAQPWDVIELEPISASYSFSPRRVN